MLNGGDPTDSGVVSVEPEVPAIEDEEAGETEATEETNEGEAEEAEPEFEEVERNGKKIRLPKEVVPELMMHRDYTQKTQELAEQRRAFEAERQRQVEFDRKHAVQIAALDQIDQYLSKAAAFNWDALREEDPAAFEDEWKNFEMARWKREKTAQELNASWRQFEEDERKSYAQAEQAARDLARKTFKDWSDDTEKAIVEYATATLSKAARQSIAKHPEIVIALEKARRFDALVSKKQSQPINTQSLPKAAEPSPRVKGTGQQSTSLYDAKLTPEEWVRRRNEQLRSRKG